MRVLLDECLPRRLKSELPGHDVRTVPEVGWAGKGNGELLQLAAGNFDAFVTVDKNLASQQDLSKLPLAVVVLHARDNRIETLRSLLPDLLNLLQAVSAGEVRHLPPRRKF